MGLALGAIWGKLDKLSIYAVEGEVCGGAAHRHGATRL